MVSEDIDVIQTKHHFHGGRMTGRTPWKWMGRMVEEEKLLRVLERREDAAVERLLPGHSSRVRRAGCKTSKAVASNPRIVAKNLVVIKREFPKADACVMASHGACLQALLDDQFENKLMDAKGRLETLLPDVDLDALVEAQPLYMLKDIEWLLGAIKRLCPEQKPSLVIARDPNIILKLQSNEHGGHELGPGAEF